MNVFSNSKKEGITPKTLKVYVLVIYFSEIRDKNGYSRQYRNRLYQSKKTKGRKLLKSKSQQTSAQSLFEMVGLFGKPSHHSFIEGVYQTKKDATDGLRDFISGTLSDEIGHLDLLTPGTASFKSGTFTEKDFFSQPPRS